MEHKARAHNARALCYTVTMSNQTQSYPTTTRMFIAEMQELGYSFDDAHQSLEFIKGMSMLMGDTVTQTARNKTLAFMVNNGCPKR